MHQPLGRHARFFFIWFWVELGLYVRHVYLGVQAGEGLLSLLLDVLLIFAAIRLVAVGGNFLQTWLARSPKLPEHEIGLWDSLKLYWNEVSAAMWTYPFYFAFEPWLSPNKPKPGLPHQGPPIVLVPGFLCNRGYFGKFRRFLEKNGYGCVYTVTVEPVLGSIDDNGAHLAELVEQVCAETGADKVILVGHSMGGVTIRSYLHRHGGEKRIAQAISLGSPFGGTVLAKGPSFLGENLKQMIAGSAWSTEFRKVDEQACPVKWTAIWSPHDSVVAPQDSCLVSETYGKNVVLPGVGHMEMVVSQPVFDVVLAEIQAG